MPPKGKRQNKAPVPIPWNPKAVLGCAPPQKMTQVEHTLLKTMSGSYTEAQNVVLAVLVRRVTLLQRNSRHNGGLVLCAFRCMYGYDGVHTSLPKMKCGLDKITSQT